MASARRRGVARTGVALLAEWAFEALGLVRLQALVHPENHASKRLLAGAGFTHEGRLRSYEKIRGERWDMEVFSLLAGEAPPNTLGGTP